MEIDYVLALLMMRRSGSSTRLSTRFDYVRLAETNLADTTYHL